ncbi:expressed unknown protein [Seminavis robusta]|uniref:Transmembrane protein n=1 Tax=Seminavis robusta TaxID=568900 RepID=A0A9N8DCS3_9STRA|nr:expressed unknown protein [Seminavis robusta]|eukprot:Sro32_g020650.1 n/a (279) ;mRNA; f:27857-28693
MSNKADLSSHHVEDQGAEDDDLDLLREIVEIRLEQHRPGKKDTLTELQSPAETDDKKAHPQMPPRSKDEKVHPADENKKTDEILANVSPRRQDCSSSQLLRTKGQEMQSEDDCQNATEDYLDLEAGRLEQKLFSTGAVMESVPGAFAEGPQLSSSNADGADTGIASSAEANPTVEQRRQTVTMDGDHPFLEATPVLDDYDAANIMEEAQPVDMEARRKHERELQGKQRFRKIALSILIAAGMVVIVGFLAGLFLGRRDNNSGAPVLVVFVDTMSPTAV